MSFAIFDADVVMCSGESVVIYDTLSCAEKTIVLPRLIPKSSAHRNNLEVDSFHATTNVSFSRDGRYFLVCTNRKQLCLYRRADRELVSNRTLIRAASMVKFGPDDEIIVADKAGEAYLYSTSRPDEEGRLLLGHVSMLLDVLVTQDSRHVITADRDEKIRVSMFPNSYNIVSYCLGHDKFVTNISELPHDGNILVSVGGDGFLKFWDYPRGRQTLSMDLRESLTRAEIAAFNEKLRDCELEEAVDVLPAKHLRTSRLGETQTLIAVSFYGCARILVYAVTGEREVERKSPIADELGEPLECALRDRRLWILYDRGLRVHAYDGEDFHVAEELNGRLEKLNESWRCLRESVTERTLFPILYKRRRDNAQEYQERKRSRLTKAAE